MCENILFDELKQQLQDIEFTKYLSDESAFRLYQIVSTVFDAVVEACKPKITRYLQHCHGIPPLPDYDPEKYYDDNKPYRYHPPLV